MRRCKKWKTCDQCAKVRQAQIATVAENGAESSKVITMAVIRTYSSAKLAKDKTAMIAKLKNTTDGGIWTVEQGEELGNLHINIITGTKNGINADVMAKVWQSGCKTDADIWAQDVEKAGIRKIAAYIAKKRQFPQKNEYKGRFYGSWGDWKTPLGALSGSKHAIPAAAALEQMLKSVDVELSPMSKKESHKEKILRQARNQQEETKAKMHNIMQRVLAAASGEICTKGFAYIDGHGIKVLADLRDAGLISAERMRDIESRI